MTPAAWSEGRRAVGESQIGTAAMTGGEVGPALTRAGLHPDNRP